MLCFLGTPYIVIMNNLYDIGESRFTIIRGKLFHLLWQFILNYEVCKLKLHTHKLIYKMWSFHLNKPFLGNFLEEMIKNYQHGGDGMPNLIGLSNNLNFMGPPLGFEILITYSKSEIYSHII